MDDPQIPKAGMLPIVGTNRNDRILIEPRSSNRLQVRVKYSGKPLGIFDRSETGRIVALGLAGNDVLVVDSRLSFDAELHGNNGNDKLNAQEHDDILIGGTTAYDEDEEALLAILAEWNSAATFETGTEALAAVLHEGTLIDDGDRDELIAGAVATGTSTSPWRTTDWRSPPRPTGGIGRQPHGRHRRAP